jgi:PPOX class probable F420-dependent enzyme
MWPDPATPFGKRVRERLETERIVWFTTVGADGTPQPNPVWFVWDGADEIMSYNRPDAHRITHVEARPDVALHFNSDRHGMDVVVARGFASVDRDATPPDQSADYLEKYRDAMIRISGTLESFAAVYSLGVRVRLTRLRGY